MEDQNDIKLLAVLAKVMNEFQNCVADMRGYRSVWLIGDKPLEGNCKIKHPN